MSFVVGAVTLPIVPFRTTEVNPATLKVGDYPGAKPLIVSVGLKERKVTVEGYIFEYGSTKEDLVDDYITPLRAQSHTVVTVTTPDGVWDGDYIQEDFQFEASFEFPSAFKYKILLTQGSDMVVL
jgi:hypothetical protein